jgi:hypothetical protein
MSPFHNGMNHWQRQWLSDRLHRKSHDTTPTPAHIPLPLSLESDSQRKPKKHPEIAKVLRLKPNATKALKLLEEASYKDSPELVRVLLDAIPPDQLNNTTRHSSSALEKFVARGYLNFPGSISHNEEHLKSIEQLLDAGARWNPPAQEIRGVRRDLMRYDARYIVQLLRLLFYAQNVANIEQLLELCRSKALEDKIITVDQPLVSEIKALRKSKHPIKASDTAAEMGSPPAAAEISRTQASTPTQPASEPPQTSNSEL